MKFRLRLFAAVVLVGLLAVAAQAAVVNPTLIGRATRHVEWAAAINDTLTLPTQASLTEPNGIEFTAESTQVLPTTGLRAVWVRISATPAGGDTTNLLRLGIRVRGLRSATTNDSTTAGAWRRIPTTASGVDTFGTTNIYTNVGGARGGEISVGFDNRYYLPSAFRRPGNDGNAQWVSLVGSRNELPGFPFMQIIVRGMGPVGGGKVLVRLDVIGQRE